MPEHTPGPWKLEVELLKNYTQFEHGLSYLIMAQGKSDFSIGKITGPSNQGQAAEVQANARLIATAPDLLILLKMVDKRLDIEAEEIGGNYILSATHRDIKQAIIKATV